MKFFHRLAKGIPEIADALLHFHNGFLEGIVSNPQVAKVISKEELREAIDKAQCMGSDWANYVLRQYLEQMKLENEPINVQQEYVQLVPEASSYVLENSAKKKKTREGAYHHTTQVTRAPVITRAEGAYHHTATAT